MARPRVGYMGTDEPEPRFRAPTGPAAGFPPHLRGQPSQEMTDPEMLYEGDPAGAEYIGEEMPPTGAPDGYEGAGDLVMNQAETAGIDPSNPAMLQMLRERYPDDPELLSALDYIETMLGASAGSDPALLGGTTPMGPPGGR